MESKYEVLYECMGGNYTKRIISLFDESPDLTKKDAMLAKRCNCVAAYTRDEEDDSHFFTTISLSKINKKTFVTIGRSDPVNKSEKKIVETRKLLTSILNEESFVLH